MTISTLVLLGGPYNHKFRTLSAVISVSMMYLVEENRDVPYANKESNIAKNIVQGTVSSNGVTCDQS